MAQVLVTGGAGFIGGHLTRHLVELGHRVRVFDSLDPRVHGLGYSRPPNVHREAELVVGDLRNADLLQRALERVEVVFHLAARIGLTDARAAGDGFCSVNSVGTKVLMRAIASQSVRRVILTSSMRVYGEGLYRDPGGLPTTPPWRSPEQLDAGRWEPLGPRGEPLVAAATPESTAPCFDSTYALSKYDQEWIVRSLGSSYGIEAVVLRLFNVYGPEQPMTHPYSRIFITFAARLLEGRRPMVYEDGLQERDFVSVDDVARACIAAMNAAEACNECINIGTGCARSVHQVAEQMADAMGRPGLKPEIIGRHRAGDVRHCYADITLARQLLGFVPAVPLERGIVEFVESLRVPLVGRRSMFSKRWLH